MHRFMTSLSILGTLSALSPLGVLALTLSACADDEDRSNPDGSAASGGIAAAAGQPGSAGDNPAAGAAHGGSTSEGGTSSGGGTTGIAGDASAGQPGSAGDTGAAGDTGGAGAPGLGLGPAPVRLGTARNYAILAKSAISNVPTSIVTGNLGLSPAAATYVTGFALTKAGTSWTSAQVVGGVFAANNDPPTPTELTTAIGDMQAAYTDAAGRSLPDALNLGGGAIGGLTLEPGLYKWTSSVTIPTDVTLAGSADDVWIFQVSGDLKLSAAQQILLSGGADPAHVFWQVAGTVDLGTTSHAEGIMLSKTAIKLQTGSSINGRLLAQTAVNLAKATVTAP